MGDIAFFVGTLSADELAAFASDPELQNLYHFVFNNPVNAHDFLGLDTRFWDWMGCMDACIKDNDPVQSVTAKIIVAIGGAPVPKVLVAQLAKSVGDHKLAKLILATMKAPGASKWTTIPSALSAKLKMGGRSTFRVFGRAAHGLLIGYGVFMAGIETHCAGHCCGIRHYDPSIGNISDAWAEKMAEAMAPLYTK